MTTLAGGVGYGYFAFHVVNIASNQNGVGYGPWIHVDGWSEAIIEYIVELETICA